MLRCAFIPCVFRESAKVGFLQAQNKLKAVIIMKMDLLNLEMARDVLMIATQTHLERDLQQGRFSLLFHFYVVIARFALQVLHWLIEFKSWEFKIKRIVSLKPNAKRNMMLECKVQKLHWLD
jgi:hypothetical protein